MLKIYKVSLITIIGLVALYALQGYYPDFIAFFSNAFPPLIAGAAVIVSGVSLERYWRKISDRFSAIWLYFTCGLFLWFVGEAVWAGYTLIMGVELPYPSVADVFWLAGYIPFFAALCSYVKLFGGALTRKTLALSLAATFTLTIFVAFALFIPVLEAGDDLVTTALNIAYPLLDLSLFSVAHLGLIIFWKGKLGKPWLIINAALAVNTFAYILFSYATTQGVYYSGHMIDVLFQIAYLLFLVAFYVHAKEF
ncbi:MAG: hypothetical protein ACPL0C_04695 [Candidatus Bathyarchaeales archaeon]